MGTGMSEPTVALLLRAFPSGLKEDDYRGAATVLKPYMSYRGLAEAMAAATGKDVGETYNDALAADAGTLATVSEVRAALERLTAAGLEAWAEEE